MSEFAYESSAWNRRAQVAGAAGRELGELAGSLRNLVSRNYFGETCEEGDAIFITLRKLVDTGASELDRLAASADQLSRSSTIGAVGLTHADSVSSAVFPR